MRFQQRSGGSTFLNFTNHPSARWEAEQLAAARRWGEIRDLPFPSVGADLDEAEVNAIAAAQVEKILAMKPDAVLCQGEMTLSYQVTRRLLQAGIVVVAACSERIVVEFGSPDGGGQKLSLFHFCRFRAYDTPRAAERE